MAKIAIMGHGVVGSGVAEVVRMNCDVLKARSGETINLGPILDLRDFSDTGYDELFTKDFNDILNDDSICVVAETMGGINPGYEFTKELLKKGKSVVSSNKELVAQKGDELLAIAKENNVNYLFEASVGGGIPIIRPLHNCLSANKINYIEGILNGTTNFIMAKMIEDDMSFEQALKLAQDLGYAEKDPTADVSGADATRKICILASLAYGSHIYPEQVHQYGIADISLADVAFLSAAGGIIKLIGRAEMLKNGKVSIMVCPAVIKDDSMLSSVKGVNNAVLVNGNAVGDVLFVGPGAGKLPTASAVVADIVDAVKANGTSISQTWGPANENAVSNYREQSNKFYLRFKSDNTKEIISFIEKNYVSPTFLSREDQPIHEIAFITGVMNEQIVKDLTLNLNEMGATQVSKIRVFF